MSLKPQCANAGNTSGEGAIAHRLEEIDHATRSTTERARFTTENQGAKKHKKKTAWSKTLGSWTKPVYFTTDDPK
jgi:hypothetical protein